MRTQRTIMKDYETYTVDDFIQDEDFQDWVRGQRSRAPFWLSFLQRYPQKQDAFRQAEQFVRATWVAPERISEAEIRKETERFIEAASTYTNHRYSLPADGNSRNVAFGKPWRWTAAALMLLISGVIGYATFQRPAASLSQSPSVASPPFVKTINETPHPLRLLLSDSSEVVLSPKSQLRYPARFLGSARIVYLKGEARFSVKRQMQPFMVYSGETVTKVLGTQFVVRAFEADKKITVQVLSGKVSVYKAQLERRPTNKEVNGLILHPNQAAIFEKSDGTLTKTLVTNPSLLDKTNPVSPFVYEEVPLPLILRELEKRYGIPIQFDEQSFAGCRITAGLASETLYEKLDLLCKAASANYEITDGQIVISRKAGANKSVPEEPNP